MNLGARTGNAVSRYPTSLQEIVITALSGLANTLGVCWPFEYGFDSGQPVWWLQILGMAAFVWMLHHTASGRQAAKVALFFSTISLTAGFSWLFVSLHTFGGLPALIAGLSVLALALALSSYYALAVWIWWRVRKARPDISCACLASAWLAAELARGTWFTGFGWGAIGYAHTTGPFSWLAPYIGVYGIAWVSVWFTAKCLERGLMLRNKVLPLLTAGLVIGAAALGGPWTEKNGTMEVSLLQGNIPQGEKFETGSGVPRALQWYGVQLNDASGDLVIAPETAIPLLPHDLPEGYWQTLSARFQSGSTAAMFGVPLGDFKDGYTNTVVAFAPQQPAWRYDKHHLVPFGEFIPPLFKWFTRMMNIPLGDFNRGDVGQPPFIWKGQRIGANICYEDLFGEELAVRFFNPATAPTVFVNVSNLAWFGDSNAMDQHLNISRMRALEFERPFVRATNTGITGIMDHQGILVHALPRKTTGVLTGQVEGRSGTTPFAWWMSRYGLWPYWILIMVSTIFALRKGHKAGSKVF